MNIHKIKIVRDIVKPLGVIFCVFILWNEGDAAFELLEDGVEGLSMGGAGVARLGPGTGVGFNPAGICYAENMDIFCSYRKLYNINSLVQNQFSFDLPAKGMGWGLRCFDFGNRLYREDALGISAGAGIKRWMTIGLTATYYHLNLEGEGEAGNWGLNLGGLWRISGSIVGGTVLTNVTAAKIGESGEGIPRTTAIGLGLMPEEGYHIYLDWFKDERFPPENRMGIEIDKIRWIVFRMGASTRPINISGGLEFRARPCKVNYAFYWHNQLGWTNIFGIGFKLGRGLD